MRGEREVSARDTFERASRISRGVRALIIPPALPGVAISASSFHQIAPRVADTNWLSPVSRTDGRSIDLG